MRVTGKRVLLRHALMPEKKGSLYIPDKFRGSADEGVVIGLGRNLESPEVEPGDRVLFTKRSGVVLKVGDSKLRLLNYDDVLAQVDVGKVRLCPACNGQGTVTDAEEN